MPYTAWTPQRARPKSSGEIDPDRQPSIRAARLSGDARKRRFIQRGSREALGISRIRLELVGAWRDWNRCASDGADAYGVDRYTTTASAANCRRHVSGRVLPVTNQKDSSSRSDFCK